MRWRLRAPSHHLRALLLAAAEILRGQRDERLADVIAALVVALDRADEIADRLGIAERDDRGRRGGDDLWIRRVHGATRAGERLRLSSWTG